MNNINSIYKFQLLWSEFKMVGIKNKSLGLVCAFLFAIILCGASSAASTHFSSDGKNITITNNYVNSTLKTSVTTKTYSGIYGYGKYSTTTASGKDDKGRNSYRIMTSFNYMPKTMIYKVSSPGFSLYESYKYTNSKITLTIVGRMNSTVTFNGTGYCPIYTVNGEKLINNGVINVNYYQNGKIFAKTTQKSTYSYNMFYGQYNTVKSSDTVNTVYTNGNTRKTVVTSLYTRNSTGTLTGLKVAGTSQGTEKINNKIVSYTGKIYINSRYDPKDLLNEKYNMGDYKEVLTSSSPTLLKIVPFESIDSS